MVETDLFQVDFQVVSDKMGFGWRLFPEGGEEQRGESFEVGFAKWVARVSFL